MTKRRWGYLLALLLTCVLITIGEWALFSHYNLLLGGKEVAPQTRAAAQPLHHIPNVQVMNDNPHLAALSEHGGSFAYVDPNNTLHVIDLANGKSVLDLPVTDTAAELDWIGDDSLFLGTEIDNGYNKTLVLSTVNASTGETRKVQDFQGYAKTSTFKGITYSPYTNDVYVLLGGDTSSIMYHFNTNGEMSRIYLGGRLVTDAAVTQTNNELFFQDKVNGTPNVLKYSKGSIVLVHSNSTLLRVLNDTVFFSVLDSSGNVIRVDEDHDGTTSVFMVLDQPTPPDKIFVNNDGHVITVSGNAYKDERTNKITPLPQYTNLVIRDNAMLFFASDGKMTVVS